MLSLSAIASAHNAGMLVIVCLIAVHSAFGATAHLTTVSPSSGVAGVTNANITGSGFPSIGSMVAADVVVTFAASCGGAVDGTSQGNTIKVIAGNVDRVNFNVPSGLPTGTYFISITDTLDGAGDFASDNCAVMDVTGSSSILNACVAGSSIGILLPPAGAAGTVTAYVPKGYWSGATTGVFVKNIEGAPGPAATVETANIVNSCSSNPATGETICVANNTDVYRITGTTLNATLTSGSDALLIFPDGGGGCNNCGIAINAANNSAVINMGLSGTTEGGVQILNLGTGVFSPPFKMTRRVSEAISVDPTRSLILTAGQPLIPAGETNNYTILQLQADGSLKEFDATFFDIGLDGFADSSAEDCSTGVAIAPALYSPFSSVQMVNLNAAVLTPGSPGTYTAPHALADLFPPGYAGCCGVSGAAVAQGSGHLAVVTANCAYPRECPENGGGAFAVLQLPATAGAAVPSLVDYATTTMPINVACGPSGNLGGGFDPHAVTAYTSPNTGDSMAVFAGYSDPSSGSTPICLAVVDMNKVMTATRGGTSTPPHGILPFFLTLVGAVNFFTLP
jgi:hypothetical protein